MHFAFAHVESDLKTDLDPAPPHGSNRTNKAFRRPPRGSSGHSPDEVKPPASSGTCQVQSRFVGLYHRVLDAVKSVRTAGGERQLHAATVSPLALTEIPVLIAHGVILYYFWSHMTLSVAVIVGVIAWLSSYCGYRKSRSI